jgi:hypothetical protein
MTQPRGLAGKAVMSFCGSFSSTRCRVTRTSFSLSPALAAVACWRLWNMVDVESSSIPTRTWPTGASPSRCSATLNMKRPLRAAERALAISGRHSWALTTLASIYAAWDKPENACCVPRIGDAERRRRHSALDACTRSRRGGRYGSSDRVRAAGAR